MNWPHKRLDYYVLECHGHAWRIVAGPFPSRAYARKSDAFTAGVARWHAAPSLEPKMMLAPWHRIMTRILGPVMKGGTECAPSS